MSDEDEKTTIRGNKKLINEFSKLAWDNDTTPPQLLNASLRAMIQYVEREGELPTPFAIVPRREMEAFQRWQQSQGLKSVDSTDIQAEETA